jgi:hypothetical protein
MGSLSQPIRSMTLDPIESAAAERTQWPHVIGEQRQTDWKHPQSDNRQEPENTANCEQQARRDPKPAA